MAQQKTHSGFTNRPLRIDRSTQTLRERALEKMHEAILRFHFRPGDRLVERQLCASLGVSRSVVREVLRHLEAVGLVENVPHQGPIVARFDPHKVAQIYEIRGALEALAAHDCAEIATPDDAQRLAEAIDNIDAAFDTEDHAVIVEAVTTFYELMFSISGKDVAWSIVQSLNARINHLRAVTIDSRDRRKQALTEMRRIQQAIAEDEPQAAYDAALDHVRTVAHIAREALA